MEESKMKNPLYNIYYINFPKVYEIKMMLSNIIALNREKESNESNTDQNEMRGRLGANFLNLLGSGLNIEGGGSMKNLNSNSQKVIDTFEIKTTKSVILSEVIDQCQAINNLEDLQEGTLIKVDKVSLSLKNEAELRTVKLFGNGGMKGLNIPGVNGVDSDKLFNSMMKDYAYKIQGKFGENEESMIIKIPLTFESEFESSYSIDDLFIGSVSVVGLYKGKVKPKSLKNSFEFFQEVGALEGEEVNEFGIENSQHDTSQFTIPTEEYSDKDLHYIDLLSIIQNVIVQ